MSKSDLSKDYKEILEKDIKEKDSQLGSFFQNDRAAVGSVHFDTCEICDSICLDPSINNMSRLLRVTIRVRHVCPGKELTVGCIVMDRGGRLLAFKSDTFIARPGAPVAVSDAKITDEKDSSSCGCTGTCIDVVRIFTFILPDSDICSPLDVIVKAIVNYTSPCC